MSPATATSSIGKPIPQKLRRNERERKRVNQVNQGFNKLRDRVPREAGCKQKLSKVETLREAVRYIQLLQSQLGITNTNSTNPSTLHFPTPEHSPNYPPPKTTGYDYNHHQSISPFYPPPQTTPMMMVQYPPSGNNQTSALSPGSSFSSYEDHY